jgi:hypothetical protein
MHQKFCFCKLKTFEKNGICNLISNPKFIWIWHNWTKDWKWNFYSPTKLWSSSNMLICIFKKFAWVSIVWWCKNQHWIWNGDWVQIWDMHHWCSPTQDSEELIERRHLYFFKRNWSHLYCTFHCHWLAYLYRQDFLKTKPLTRVRSWNTVSNPLETETQSRTHLAQFISDIGFNSNFLTHILISTHFFSSFQGKPIKSLMHIHRRV